MTPTPASIALAMTFANTAPTGTPAFVEVRSRAALAQRTELPDVVAVGYATPPGATLAAVIHKSGFDLADRALAAGSLFFKTNPAAAEMLEGMRGRPLDEPFELFAFKDMHAALGALGFSFVGPARMADAIAKLNFSRAAMDLLQAETDVVLREMKKDLMLNRGHRIDIFARNPQRLEPQDAAQRIAQMTFKTLRADIDKLGLITAYAEIKPTDHARRVFAALLPGPASAAQLTQRAPDCPDVWRNMEAMLALAAMEAVEPVQGEDVGAAP